MATNAMYAHTHGLRCYLAHVMKYTKHGAEGLEVELITRACLKVLEPREPGGILHVWIVSDLL